MLACDTRSLTDKPPPGFDVLLLVRGRLFVSDTLRRGGLGLCSSPWHWGARCHYRAEEEMGFELLCSDVYENVTELGLTLNRDIQGRGIHLERCRPPPKRVGIPGNSCSS